MSSEDRKVTAVVSFRMHSGGASGEVLGLALFINDASSPAAYDNGPIANIPVGDDHSVCWEELVRERTSRWAKPPTGITVRFNPVPLP